MHFTSWPEHLWDLLVGGSRFSNEAGGAGSHVSRRVLLKAGDFELSDVLHTLYARYFVQVLCYFNGAWNKEHLDHALEECGMSAGWS